MIPTQQIKFLLVIMACIGTFGKFHFGYFLSSEFVFWEIFRKQPATVESI